MEKYVQLAQKEGSQFFHNLPYDSLKGQVGILADRLTVPAGFSWRDFYKDKLRLTKETEVNDANYQKFFSYLQEAISQQVFHHEKDGQAASLWEQRLSTHLDKH